MKDLNFTTVADDKEQNRASKNIVPFPIKNGLRGTCKEWGNLDSFVKSIVENTAREGESHQSIGAETASRFLNRVKGFEPNHKSVPTELYLDTLTFGDLTKEERLEYYRRDVLEPPDGTK